jgi:hypothetical protein
VRRKITAEAAVLLDELLEELEELLLELGPKAV